MQEFLFGSICNHLGNANRKGVSIQMFSDNIELSLSTIYLASSTASVLSLVLIPSRITTFSVHQKHSLFAIDPISHIGSLELFLILTSFLTLKYVSDSHIFSITKFTSTNFSLHLTQFMNSEVPLTSSKLPCILNQNPIQILNYTE